MVREIEMEMVAMKAVVARAEHRREILAGSIMDAAQKSPLPLRAEPAARHADGPSVRQPEAADVDGIGIGVLRDERPFDTIHRPARIRGKNGDFGELLAEMKADRWLDHLLHPTIDLRDHRTAQRGWGPEGHTAVIRCRHLEGVFSTADARAAKCRPGTDERCLLNDTRGEASPLLWSPPRIVPDDEIRSGRPAAPKHTES